MKRLFAVILMLMIVAVWALEPRFATDPAVSPDGSEICFVYDGELWRVPWEGGAALRLTATQEDEFGPQWSPDGKTIAFNSNRGTGSFVYLMPAQGGEARAVFEESYTLCDWYADGQALLVTRYNPGFGSSFYKMPLDGGRPVLLAEIGDRFASLSPDNKKIVFNRRGDPHREAYRGSTAGELWEIDIETKSYARLTFTDYTERYPRHSHTGDRLYYCASDGERFQIHSADGMDFSQPRQLTNFPQWSARDINVARQNDRMAFEMFDEIWTWEPQRGAAKLELKINEDHWQRDLQSENVKDAIEAFAVSGDDLLVGFKYKYDAFFMPRKGGEVMPAGTDLTAIGSMEFLEDGRSLALRMMDGGIGRLFSVKCEEGAKPQRMEWFGADSLDVDRFYRDEASGKWVLFYGDKLQSGRIAVGGPGLEDLKPINNNRASIGDFAINSTGEYAVFATTREDVWMRELWLHDFASGENRKLMNDDLWVSSLAWLPDNSSILIGRGGDIYRLDLVPRDEFEFETDNWDEIFKPSEAKSDEEVDLEIEIDISEEKEEESPEKPAVPLNIVWEGLEKRLYPILQENGRSLSVEAAIDDSTFYYYSWGSGEESGIKLKKANIQGKNAKDVHDLGRKARSPRRVGGKLYWLDDGKISWVHLEKRSKGEVGASFKYEYSLNKLNTRVFEQVWGAFGLNFYDPNMHGQDWDALYELYHPYAEQARNISDIAAIVNEMIGDVDASHTGFYPRREGSLKYESPAYLPLEFDWQNQPELGLTVRLVYPNSPLFAYHGLKEGDLLTAIDGVSIGSKTPVDKLLLGKEGRRITLDYLSDGEAKQAVLTGLSLSEIRELRYDYETGLSRKKVDELTGGRVGYIHIPSMGTEDYSNFLRDLFRDNVDKDALIIDVRGNTGGHIHDQIINLLNRQPYAWSTSRRYSGIQNLEPRKVWTRPSIVLADEGSFSDGEIFPTVYQELGLGKVVGQPSSGSVIGTWQYRLLDGSSMRMPGSGWYRLDGTNMEGTGVQPDILVEISPEEQIAGHDTQLLRAIEEILKELP